MSVFVSYNHGDGEDIANKIFDNLSYIYNVTFNFEETDVFDIQISEEIDDCTDYIIVITENVLKAQGNENDAVLNEAKLALLKNKNIIPVFCGIKNVPDDLSYPLKTIFGCKGAAWTDEVQSCRRIQSLLVSKKSILLDFDKYCKPSLELSDSSKEALKVLYKSFVKDGRQPVDVEITTTIKDAAISRSLKREIPALQAAVQYMLADEKLDFISSHYPHIYDKIIAKGKEDCNFIDENFEFHPMITPYLWMDILLEIMEYVVVNKPQYKKDTEKYYAVDCFIKDRQGNQAWSFRSWLPKESEHKTYPELMKKLNVIGYILYSLEFPSDVLALNVYPDFYYRLGLLKTENEKTFNKLSEINGAFDFNNYLIGLA